jgi:NAD-dependent deacetylase
MEEVTPEGFEVNPKLVLDFYNKRKKQLLEVLPNKAYYNLVDEVSHLITAYIK